MHHHKRLQKRVLIGTCIVAVLAVIIAIPLIVLEDERYQLAMDLELIPGKDAVRLTDENDGAQLLIVPLENDDEDSANPWLYRAQFIAWPNDDGTELEHLETHERVQVPLTTIDFTSTNADGSLILMRGPLAATGENAAITVAPGSMVMMKLPTAESVPNEPGDWDTPSWEKTYGLCSRPSEHRRFVGCFTRAGGASYFAGDWQLDLQIYGDYETVHPLYRGQGFVPWIGFAENDTVVYLQNENGIVRIDVPENIVDVAPAGTPYTAPAINPAATPRSWHTPATSPL